jgi:hypothetical protein
MSGVDESLPKFQRLKHKMQEQPKSIEAGKGVLTSNFHEFALILIDYIYIERELERIKVDLIKQADFNLMDCFKLFDWSNRAHLSPSDILQSLNTYFQFCDTKENWEVEINPKYENQFYLLYRRFDLNYDSLLDFSEFSKMILPLN